MVRQGGERMSVDSRLDGVGVYWHFGFTAGGVEVIDWKIQVNGTWIMHVVRQINLITFTDNI